MHRFDTRAACAAYTLGLLDDAQRRAFEQHLTGCADCQGEMHAQRGLVAALGLGAARAPASARLKRQLLSAMAVDTHYTLRAGEGDWESDARGPAVRRLFLHPRDGSETRMLRIAPGQGSNHAGLPPGSAVYVLEGRLELDGVTLAPGDFHRRAGSARDVPPRAQDGALALALAFTPGDAACSRIEARTVRRDQGAWRPLGPGTRGRLLLADTSDGITVSCAAMEAGHEYPEHDHDGAEELYMLEGDCAFEDQRLAAGDYHRAGHGSHHAITRSAGGCVMLVVHRHEHATR